MAGKEFVGYRNQYPKSLCSDSSLPSALWCRPHVLAQQIDTKANPPIVEGMIRIFTSGCCSYYDFRFCESVAIKGVLKTRFHECFDVLPRGISRLVQWQGQLLEMRTVMPSCRILRYLSTKPNSIKTSLAESHETDSKKGGATARVDLSR